MFNFELFSCTGTPRSNAFYGRGTGQILLDDLLCRGTEERLIDCPIQTGGIGMVDFCTHGNDAGLECLERKYKIIHIVMQCNSSYRDQLVDMYAIYCNKMY